MDGGTARPVPAEHTVVVYVLDGVVGCGGERLCQRTLAQLLEGELVEQRSDGSGARVLVLAGRPTGEQVAWRGPIVMNTEKELLQAFKEYRDGTFLHHQAVPARHEPTHPCPSPRAEPVSTAWGHDRTRIGAPLNP